MCMGHRVSKLLRPSKSASRARSYRACKLRIHRFAPFAAIDFGAQAHRADLIYHYGLSVAEKALRAAASEAKTSWDNPLILRMSLTLATGGSGARHHWTCQRVMI